MGVQNDIFNSKLGVTGGGSVSGLTGGWSWSRMSLFRVFKMSVPDEGWVWVTGM